MNIFVVQTTPLEWHLCCQSVLAFKFSMSNMCLISQVTISPRTRSRGNTPTVMLPFESYMWHWRCGPNELPCIAMASHDSVQKCSIPTYFRCRTRVKLMCCSCDVLGCEICWIWEVLDILLCLPLVSKRIIMLCGLYIVCLTVLIIWRYSPLHTKLLILLAMERGFAWRTTTCLHHVR